VVRRRIWQAVALLSVAAMVTTCGGAAPGGRARWDSPGLIGGGGWPYARSPISPLDAKGASYLPESSVLRLANGMATLIPNGSGSPITVPMTDERVHTSVASDRAWLAAGAVPGASAAHRGMASRALLDLRLLTAPSGASTASWYGIWNYAWPRDAAFHAAAFAVTGHTDEALRILGFLARVQGADGRWATRYRTDGSPVIDGRSIQLDEMGWVLWATWLVRQYTPKADFPTMVGKAADWISRSLGADGLPPASSDYFERRTSTEQVPGRPTLGVSAPLLTGLRSAAALAKGTPQAQRWAAAAARLDAGIKKEYGTYGYPRSPLKGGNMDLSVTFLAPPYAAPDPSVADAVAEAIRRLKIGNGGVLPGENWAGSRVEAWTPEVAMFALTAASSGRMAEADTWLDWLEAHRTVLGVIPEKVNDKGRASSVAPLGWAASLTVLALSAQQRPLPVPPAETLPNG
jgi:GH15 family glucan-1,4-alpha-glucosidase